MCLKVLEDHIQFLAKLNNLQNVKTKKEMWHENLPSVKYDPEPTADRRSGNPRMMIKVRHTDCQLYACVKRTQQDLMEGIYCKKYQWSPKIRN